MKAMKRIFKKGSRGGSGRQAGGAGTDSLRSSSHHEDHAAANDSRSVSSGHHSAPMVPSTSFEPDTISNPQLAEVPAAPSPQPARPTQSSKATSSFDSSSGRGKKDTENGALKRPVTSKTTTETATSSNSSDAMESTASSLASHRGMSQNPSNIGNGSLSTRTISNKGSATNETSKNDDNHNVGTKDTVSYGTGDKNRAVSSSSDDDDDDVLDDKGVSPSFKGLNMTARFDEGPAIPQAAEAIGRMASISDAYDAIPLIEQTKLPRGGISMETKAVGRIQVRMFVYFLEVAINETERLVYGEWPRIFGPRLTIHFFFF
jgi:hypothetical protein